MGAYLDTPNTDKHSEQGTNSLCSWGVSSMQGWRCGMEDEHIASEVTCSDGKKAMLFCVFDGHGGKEVASFAKDRFAAILTKSPEWKNNDLKGALRATFMKLDAEVKDTDFGTDTGTTSCVLLVTETQIICANAGDSRSVLYTGGKAVGLSEDHKPDNAGEHERIRKANHFVEDARVDCNLALSRAFGDFQYKDQPNLLPEQQAVTADPDITVTQRKAGDKFIMNACDGIWDCLSNEECCEKLQQKLDKMKPGKTELHKVVESLLDDILAPNTEDGIGTDNMTAILVRFD